jgi:hypothetical protein
LSDKGWKEKHTPLYNLATHSLDKIVQVFDPKIGQVHTNDKSDLKVLEVVYWPVSAGLTGGAKLKSFFKWAKHLNNYHSEVPKGYASIRYQTKAYDARAISLAVFTQVEREFL